MNNTLKTIGCWIAMTLVLVTVHVVAGIIINFTLGDYPGDNQSLQFSPLIIVVVAAIEMAILMLLMQRLHYRGWKLGIVVFCLYWATKVLQMQIEALFFLNIWTTPPMMSIAELVYGFSYSTLVTLLLMPVLVWCLKIWQGDILPTFEHKVPVIPLMAFVKVAAIYVPIYFIAGVLLAVPLGGSGFEQTYANLNVPSWMPLFQFARGFLWAVILWVLVRGHRSQYNVKVTAAWVMAIFTATQLLIPNPQMNEQLRFAHMLEVAISMAIFGWLGAWIMEKQNRQPSDKVN